jgi:phosphoribosylformimino-5-aminoimidazole carboxamide ribotide isomerase
MIIFPAIDIKNGKCVRLTKGKFESEKIYNENPLDQVKIFKDAGFNYLHIIDLDGALNGELTNFNIIEKIINKFNIKVEVGGGIRNEISVSKLLDIGVDKAILGTAAIEDEVFLKVCCKKYPGQIALALDVRNNKIATSGWKNQTEISALDFLKKVENIGISRVIYTDINKDGTHEGPNLKDSYILSKTFKIPLVISGGIGSMKDIEKIMDDNKNIEGIIVGKAIYENKINLNELSKKQ